MLTNSISFYLTQIKVKHSLNNILTIFISGNYPFFTEYLNYLGHAYLTPANSELLIGNFLGDHIKGKIKKQYPEFIQRGLRLHRFIDSYTDSHPIVRSHCEIMEPKVGLLSGVAMDMLYDYVLAKNWASYSSTTLDEFAIKTYDEILNFTTYFPEKFEFMFRYMRRDNWLLAYGTEKGMLRALNGLSKRIRFDNNLADSWEVFLKNENQITKEFGEFIQDIKNEIRQEFS